MNHRFPLRLRACASLGGLLVLAACTSGQTGGQIGGPAFEDSCRETANVLEPDAQSPLGFSADDVLAFAGETHTATMAWGPGEEHQGLVEVTPEPASTELELTVTYTGGPVTFVAQDVEHGRSDEGLEPALQPDTNACSDFLLIEVEVHVQTENGAFDDTFTAQLRATSAEATELLVPFERTDLQGSFTAEPLQEGAEVKQMTWSARLTPDAFSGSVDGLIELQQGDTVSGTSVTFATWADPPTEEEEP